MRNRLAEYLHVAPLWMVFVVHMMLFSAVQAGLEAFNGAHSSVAVLAGGSAIYAGVTTASTGFARRRAPDADEEPEQEGEAPD